MYRAVLNIYDKNHPWYCHSKSQRIETSYLKLLLLATICGSQKLGRTVQNNKYYITSGNVSVRTSIMVQQKILKVKQKQED